MLKIKLLSNTPFQTVKQVANYLSQNGLYKHFEMLNVIGEDAYQPSGTNYTAVEVTNPKVGFVVWEDDQGGVLEVKVKIPAMVEIIQLELKSGVAYRKRNNLSATINTSRALNMNDFIQMASADKTYYIQSGDLLLVHTGQTVSPGYITCPYDEVHPEVRKLWQTGLLSSFLFLQLC